MLNVRSGLLSTIGPQVFGYVGERFVGQDVGATNQLGIVIHQIGKLAPEEHFDREDFLSAYAILGAQRNTKILGIFARLAERDGKRGYLAHIPRVSAYLERNLAHPSLAELKAWYDRHLASGSRAEIGSS